MNLHVCVIACRLTRTLIKASVAKLVNRRAIIIRYVSIKSVLWCLISCFFIVRHMNRFYNFILFCLGFSFRFRFFHSFWFFSVSFFVLLVIANFCSFGLTFSERISRNLVFKPIPSSIVFGFRGIHLTIWKMIYEKKKEKLNNEILNTTDFIDQYPNIKFEKPI